MPNTMRDKREGPYLWPRVVQNVVEGGTTDACYDRGGPLFFNTTPQF